MSFNLYLILTLEKKVFNTHCRKSRYKQKSTDSATDMLNELNITYNRVRQADITQELTEIIGGANAQKRK